MASKTDAALAWAARGFRVFPLRENGTKPVWQGWPETATTDPKTIRAWWDGTDYNIGVCTTGMLVVDIDTKKGRPGLQSWMSIHGAFDTLTVRTRSGGYHLYYSGANVGLSQGLLGEGLDVRSHNGYVVAPGSVVDGGTYEVVIDKPVALAPEHIVARCRPPGRRVENADTPRVDLDGPLAVKLAVERIERQAGAVQGEQSEAAYKLACAVRDFGISEHLCSELMDEWAARCSPPIMPDDLRGRVANAYAYAQNAPGAKNPEAIFSGVVIPAPPPPPPEPPRPTDLAHFGNAIELARLPPRPHLLRRLLMLRETTALLATGGAGKSLFTLTVAAHIAAGLDMFGYENVLRRPAKSIVYDAEDDMNEMSMRLHAICVALSLDFASVSANIALISGRDHGRVRLCQRNGHNPAVIEDSVKMLVAAGSDPDVVFIGLNPLNKLHTLNGNDNVEMTFVMECIEALAEATNTAVLLAHHTSKAQLGMRRAGNAEVSMGAMAVINGSRNALTLTAPEDEDAARFGLSGAERRMFLRLDDAKANRHVGGDEALWLRKVPVNLWNGEDVGALDKADMHVRTEHLRKLIARVLATEMKHTRNTGGVTVKEAVSILRGAEPMFKTLSAETVKQRILSYLAEPVQIETGDMIALDEDGKAMRVVLR